MSHVSIPENPMVLWLSFKLFFSFLFEVGFFSVGCCQEAVVTPKEAASTP